jgi:hypothetical protein
MGHEPALGFLGDSAFLIMLVFFAVAGFIVLRGLGQGPSSSPEPPDREAPKPEA